MKRALVLICLLTALGTSFAGSAAGGSAAAAAAERLGELDQRVLAVVNRTRAERGLRPLVVSKDLQRAAGSHSRQMLERGFFDHDSPDGVPFAKRVRAYYQSTGYSSWSVGENLLYSTVEVTAEMAVDAWLASPSHRENMLSPTWREVGVGSLRARAAGGTFGGKPTWVITMNFGIRSGKVFSSSSATGRSTSSRLLVSKQKAPARKKTSVTRALPGGRATLPI